MQSAYLCIILHVEHKKLLFMAVLIWFLILCKIQDGGQGGDHCWWRQRPPAAPLPIKYTSSCREDQRLATEGKIVTKYCNISKTLGRGSNTPPPSLCTTVGVWNCVYVRGLIAYDTKTLHARKQWDNQHSFKRSTLKTKFSANLELNGIIYT